MPLCGLPEMSCDATKQYDIEVYDKSRAKMNPRTVSVFVDIDVVSD